MKFLKLPKPYFVTFENVKLTNVYKSIEGKNNYYGSVKVESKDDVVLQEMNIHLSKYKPKLTHFCNLGENHILTMKFTTHYGKPKYKARRSNGLPTVAQALQENLTDGSAPLAIDVIMKIDGYVYDMEAMDVHVVLQCYELLVK